MVDKIICFPDMLRSPRHRYAEAYFDICREPIRQGTGIDIGFSPVNVGNRPHGLKPGFELERFFKISAVQVGSNENHAQWASRYHNLPKAAEEYIFDYIPPDALIMAPEIPPWFAKACIEREIDFIDVGLSPLRFCRDLHVGIRTSNVNIFRRITAYKIPEEDVRLEASILMANIRLHKLWLQEKYNYPFQNFSDGLIFFGQTPFDASRIASNPTRTLHWEDFAKQINEISQGKKIFYKGHPETPWSAENDTRELMEISGKSIEICLENSYQILSSHDNLELIGISSGILQEAPYFDKTSHTLYKAFVPLSESDMPDSHTYQQIYFQEILSPGFWHEVLTPDRPAPRIQKLPQISVNHFRETLGQYWDYSKVMTWLRPLPYEGVMRSGAMNEFQHRLEALEEQMSEIKFFKKIYE